MIKLLNLIKILNYNNKKLVKNKLLIHNNLIPIKNKDFFDYLLTLISLF
jgi:hypothetical protein